jgi:uncharacterized membrane protein YcaP (DUF421 family)
MFVPTVPLWEPVLRGALIYAALLILLRLTGKRQVGQFTPFDLVLLLLVSEAVSNALSGGDDSVTGGLIVVATMLLLNLAVGWMTTRSPVVERRLEGRPQFLIKNGRVDYAVLRRESLSKNDLLAAIRQEGCFRPREVEYAVLETSGRISVRKREAPLAQT